ncbi:MAG: hypothetical protein GY769_07675 [bacterium]|nr:hypothetical protein [bacterium]
MKKLALLAILLITLSPAYGQDIVVRVSSLTWEYTAEQMTALLAEAAGAGETAEFRMYCGQTPGVVPDELTNMVGQIAAPPGSVQCLGDEAPCLWPIVLGMGDWHCVATAWAPTIESGPSNEWYGRVISLTPGGLRLMSLERMLEDPLYMLGEAALASAMLD